MQRLQALNKELKRARAADGRGLDNTRIAELRAQIAELEREDGENVNNAQDTTDELDIGPPPSYEATIPWVVLFVEIDFNSFFV